MELIQTTRAIYATSKHRSMPQPSKIQLKSVRIQGFRSCERTSIKFSRNLSVLIGPNGAGKTNVLQALRLLRPARLPFWPLAGDVAAISRSRILADFQIDGDQVALRCTLSYALDDENREVVRGSDEEWKAGSMMPGRNATGGKWISVPAGHIGSFRPLITHHGVTSRPKRLRKSNDEWSHLEKPVRSIADFRRRITYYSAAQFTNPARCPSSIQIDEDHGVIGSPSSRREHYKFLGDLYRLKDGSPTKYAAYMSLVGKDGMGLISALSWKQVKVGVSQIDVRSGGKIVKRNRHRLLIVPSIQIGRDRLSLNQLSEGTFKTLALVFYLVTDDSDLLLIEEPEVCVHHGLLSSIVELIKTQAAEKQIIFSTHSDYVLDQVDPDQVFSVKRDEKIGTIVRSLSSDYPRRSVQALRDFLESAGNLGEYWRQGGFDH